MLQEIYCRTANEPGYNPNQLVTNSALEAFLSKVKMILFTRKGDVLGDYDLGVDLESLLFTFNFDSNAIKDAINFQVGKYCPEQINYKFDVDVNFVPGTVRDIAYIDIYIGGSKYLGIIVK